MPHVTVEYYIFLLSIELDRPGNGLRAFSLELHLDLVFKRRSWSCCTPPPPPPRFSGFRPHPPPGAELAPPRRGQTKRFRPFLSPGQRNGHRVRVSSPPPSTLMPQRRAGGGMGQAGQLCCGIRRPNPVRVSAAPAPRAGRPRRETARSAASRMHLSGSAGARLPAPHLPRPPRFVPSSGWSGAATNALLGSLGRGLSGRPASPTPRPRTRAGASATRGRTASPQLSPAPPSPQPPPLQRSSRLAGRLEPGAPIGRGPCQSRAPGRAAGTRGGRGSGRCPARAAAGGASRGLTRGAQTAAVLAGARAGPSCSAAAAPRPPPPPRAPALRGPRCGTGPLRDGAERRRPAARGPRCSR